MVGGDLSEVTWSYEGVGEFILLVVVEIVLCFIFDVVA